MRQATLAGFFLVFFIAGSAVHAGDTAPDWELVSSVGETVRLSEEAPKQTTILFFWATWCPYCKALMPHLQSIRLEHGDEVKILAINFREDDDPVAFIKNAGYDFTVLPNGDDVAATYGVYGTPGIIIVDDQQQIRFDLRKLPKQDPPADGKDLTSHRKKAAYRAPYWAAEMRKRLDVIIDASDP